MGERDLRRRSMGQRRSPLEVRVVAFLISAAERGPTSQAAHVPLSTAARMVLATILFGGGAFTRRTAYIVCVCARA